MLVEIPVADSLEDVEALLAVERETATIAMAGHVRRFNPSHQFVHALIERGKLAIQQMNVQTYFFRRTNTNALGQARSWTDHLLWHHACHTVDLFQWQTGEIADVAHAIQGPIHPTLGIAMDMSIALKVPSGAILTLSLSFNNDGPLGSFFRYIGDTGTYLAYYDDLSDGTNEKIDLSRVDVSMNGIELEDREFFAAIREGARAEVEFEGHTCRVSDPGPARSPARTRSRRVSGFPGMPPKCLSLATSLHRRSKNSMIRPARMNAWSDAGSSGNVSSRACVRTNRNNRRVRTPSIRGDGPTASRS